jgi:hypothetical protein
MNVAALIAHGPTRWDLRCAALLSLTMLLACDGLGRPVVGMNREAEEPELECVRVAPRCDDADPAPVALRAGADEGLPPCDQRSSSRARITGALRDCSLVLASADGDEREIAAVLDNVRIEVDSDVWLRIADSVFYRVTIEPRPVDPPAVATLQVSHSSLHSTRLGSEQLELISTYLRSAQVDADELSGVDLEVAESLLFARAATISASSVTNTRIAECDALLLASNKILTSTIEGCTELTRIYDVEATKCAFDGTLESDGSTFVDCRFGVAASTQLHGWGTSFDNATLCEEFDSMRYSAGSLTCVRCQGPMAEPNPDMCVDSRRPNTEANACQVLIDPPECETFPRHPRPVAGI